MGGPLSTLLSLPQIFSSINTWCRSFCDEAYFVYIIAEPCSTLRLPGILFSAFLCFHDRCCSAAQSCPTLFDSMDCSTPGLPVHHQLQELTQTHVSFTISWSLLKLMSFESVMPSNHLILCRPLLLPPSVFPASGSFPVSQVFASGGQSLGASASASVLPVNIQG